MKNLSCHPQPTGSKSAFGQDVRWLVCTLKFDKHWTEPLLSNQIALNNWELPEGKQALESEEFSMSSNSASILLSFLGE